MPVVPGLTDPMGGQNPFGSQQQSQPDPAHLMMAASDMNNEGRLIVPEDQSSHRTGGSAKLPSGRNIRPRSGSGSRSRSR